MAKLEDFVKETALQRLTDLGYEAPSDITSYVEEVGMAINNYCNTTSVAVELKFTWVNMVVDYLRWVVRIAKSKDDAASTPGSSSTGTILTSLKEGDTTLGFSADASGKAAKEENAHEVASSLDQVVMNYTDSLNRFRRVVW